MDTEIAITEIAHVMVDGTVLRATRLDALTTVCRRVYVRRVSATALLTLLGPIAPLANALIYAPRTEHAVAHRTLLARALMAGVELTALYPPLLHPHPHAIPLVVPKLALAESIVDGAEMETKVIVRMEILTDQ